MGKRYYCDFCDKAFADNPASKKNHFNGVYHIQMKKAHYDAFKDPTSILAAETAKKPCRKFQQTGVCDYGDTCRFSHLTEAKKRQLEEQCGQKQRRTRSSSSGRGQPSVVIGEVSDWLTKRDQRQKSGEGASLPKGNKGLPDYHVPSHLAAVGSLPPSLLPPSREDFVGLPLLEWG